MMDLTDTLAQTFDHAERIVAGVGDEQLDSPTPCSEWDVQSLLAHLSGVVVNMGRGASGAELLPDMNAYDLGADRGGRFRAEADRTLAAWRTRELTDMVDIGAGPMPAESAININLVDTATHSWDLARATGQEAELPDDVATAVLGVAQGLVTDELRNIVGIHPPLPAPPGSSPTAQLVAFLGRHP